MNLMYLISGLIALALIVYLFGALLKPDDSVFVRSKNDTFKSGRPL